MSAFLSSTERKKRGGRGASVTRDWEPRREGALCFINTHTHTHPCPKSPYQVKAVPVGCPQCLNSLLHRLRLAPPALTGDSVPLRLSATRRPAGLGLWSHGPVQGGESRRSVCVASRACSRWRLLPPAPREWVPAWFWPPILTSMELVFFVVFLNNLISDSDRLEFLLSCFIKY